MGNVVSHGFRKDHRKHQVGVRVILKDTDLILRIKDDCIPFDPKERAEQLTDAAPEKNIGIRMVMKLAKDIRYINTFNSNCLFIYLEG